MKNLRMRSILLGLLVSAVFGVGQASASGKVYDGVFSSLDENTSRALVQGGLIATDLAASCIADRGSGAYDVDKMMRGVGSAANCLQKMADPRFSAASKSLMFYADIMRTLAFFRGVDGRSRNYVSQNSTLSIPLRVTSALLDAVACYYGKRLEQKSGANNKKFLEYWRSARMLGAASRAAADCVAFEGFSKIKDYRSFASCVSAMSEMYGVIESTKEKRAAGTTKTFIERVVQDHNHKAAHHEENGFHEEWSDGFCPICQNQGEYRDCIVCPNGHISCVECAKIWCVSNLTPSDSGTDHPSFLPWPGKPDTFFKDQARYQQEQGLKWVTIDGKNYFENKNTWWTVVENRWKQIVIPQCSLCRTPMPSLYYAEKVKPVSGVPLNPFNR